MAVYQFSALSNGQAIAFNPGSDVLNFDQAAISAADLLPTQESNNARITVGTKSVVLQNTSLMQLASSNVTFADGSKLLFGDNSSGTANDAAANSLTGGTGDDLLAGFGGADTLLGGAGNDAFFQTADYGTGDVIDGGTGVDTLYFGVYAQSAISVNLAAATFTGSGVIKNQSIENVVGGAFGDNLVGNTLANRLEGGAGNDTMNGREGNDTLVGGDGDDTFNMSNGSSNYGVDVIDGGAGRDTVDWGNNAQSPLTVDLAAGTASGGGPSGAGSATLASIEDVVGGTYNDLLVGSASVNFLYGYSGNDTLDGGAGNDRLEGAGGADLLRFTATPGAANADTVVGFVSGADKIALDVAVYGALGSTGNFASGDVRFYSAAGASGGHDADDRVVYNASTGQLFYDADGNGAGGSQLIATLQGVPSLTATDLSAFGTVSGGVIQGTSGNDSLVGTSGNDTIDGLAGNDTIDGLAGNDSLVGGDGNDSIRGGDGDDTLTGFTYFDSATDTLDGGAGNDVYNVAFGDVIVADGGGIDTVRAWDTDWTLGPGLENLVLVDTRGAFATGIGNELDNVIDGSSYEGVALYGQAGNDLLISATFSGINQLHGGVGNDTLQGGPHTDELFGDAGNDVLTGGETGGDSFVFNVAPGVANADLITDFLSGTSTIRLDGSVIPALGPSGSFAAGDARFYAAADASAGHDGDDRVVYNTSNGQLWYDADGSGAGTAQLIATLSGAPALAATDIEVVNSSSSGVLINGTSGNDSLVGGSGNDTLDGGAGIDTMDGGQGNDTYVVTSGDVIVADPGGIDTVVTAISWSISSTPGGMDNVTIVGTSNTSTEGNNLANTIIGNEANNYMNARAGDDTLTGNGGSDYFNMSMGGTASFGHDSIDGGAGTDTVDFGTNAVSGLVADLAAGTVIGGEAGGAGSSTILNIERFIGGAYGDRVSGNSTANTFYGQGGNDTLLGLAGNDSLVGVDGNDWLQGGTGADTLVGGAGLDSFVFADAPGSANADRVQDFVSGTDSLLFENAVFTGLGGASDWGSGDTRFYAAAGATSGHDGDDRLVYNTSTGNLYYDADGSGAGAAQLVATMVGLPGVSASDITVI